MSEFGHRTTITWGTIRMTTSVVGEVLGSGVAVHTGMTLYLPGEMIAGVARDRAICYVTTHMPGALTVMQVC